MRSFSARSTETEQMDGETVSEAEFAACLADLARANYVTLARPPTIAWLRRATRPLKPGNAFSVLDVEIGRAHV